MIELFRGAEGGSPGREILDHDWPTVLQDLLFKVCVVQGNDVCVHLSGIRLFTDCTELLPMMY